MKPGYLTTEFWLQLLVAVVNALIVSDVLIPGSATMKIVSVVALVLQALGYQVSRTKAKASATTSTTVATPLEVVKVETKGDQAGFVNLGVLLAVLACFALALGSGACGGSQRSTALRTTFSAMTVAQSAFSAWDLEHQRSIVRSAASEPEGLAKLAAYKEDRVPVVDAFTVAYEALIAAGALEDDPSLKNALRAWRQLADALSKLTEGKLP